VSSAGARRWRQVDVIAAVLLSVVLAVLSALMVQFGVIVAAPADVCGGDGIRCDFARIDGAVLATRLIPAVLLVLTLAVTVFRVRRRRTVLFVPFIGLAGVVGTFYVAFAVVDGAITR
jgi:hypothetical protein